MGAETKIYVLVDKLVTEIIEVHAVTLDEAELKAEQLPEVFSVLSSSYCKEDLGDPEAP